MKQLVSSSLRLDVLEGIGEIELCSNNGIICFMDSHVTQEQTSAIERHDTLLRLKKKEKNLQETFLRLEELEELKHVDTSIADGR